MTADAKSLLRALAERHDDAVFVPECKNGPTQTGSHRRLDAWVLLKTWSPVTTIGYEIKTSRADWRRDQKLDEYAGLCHLLYVVAPKGIVPQEEVPPGVGLLELVGDRGRLVTRVKPTRREIEMPVSLMVYVLMCRAAIVVERGYEERSNQWRVDCLRKWATTKQERRDLHHLLSRRIRDEFDKQEKEIRRLTNHLSALGHIEQRIRELGFDPHDDVSRYTVERRIEELSRVIPPWLPRYIESAVKELSSVGQALAALRDPPKPLDPHAELESE